MRVLVTGAAGFLGSHITDTLIAAGHSVVGVDNMIGGSPSNLPNGLYPPNYQYFYGDVTDHKFSSGMKWVGVTELDAVYHCAALAYEGLSVFSPALVTDNIVTGTLNTMVLAINSGAKRFINCSSMARYGASVPPMQESYECFPVDPYGIAKVAAEQQLNLLGRVHRVTVVHVVPHNVYGPRQKYNDPYRNVAAIMVNRLLQGKPPLIYGDGEQVRCFSYIDDVVPVMVRMLDADVAHTEVFNVGPDKGPITVNALANTLTNIVVEPALRNLPMYEPIHMLGRPQEVREAWCSSNKIRKRFGYRTNTNLILGLSKLVDYIKEQGPKPFDYKLPIELPDSPYLPRAWKERML